MSLLIDCEVYKSSKKKDTYVYFKKPIDMDLLPSELRKSLGKLEFVMKLELNPEKKLARGDVVQVMDNIKQQGFHLQMPPSAVSLLAIHNPNVSGDFWDKG